MREEYETILCDALAQAAIEAIGYDGPEARNLIDKWMTTATANFAARLMHRDGPVEIPCGHY